MATRTEERVVNLAGLIQGITLVTFPAASSIFTDPEDYDLSGSQYGAMFLPQVAAAIAASLLGDRLARRSSAKRVLVLGLSANLSAMVVLVLTTAVEHREAVAFPLLLLATALLGAGFGLTVPSLNTFVAAFHRDRADRAVLVLNALLGLGTALAPVFVALFVGLGFWWAFPLVSAAALLVLVLVCSGLPLQAPVSDVRGASEAGIPARFWLYAGFAVLYGLCETMNGNWSQLAVTTDLGGSETQGALALTAFWAMVTVGRLLFAVVVQWVPATAVFHVLPLLLVLTFTLTASLPDDAPWAAVATFGLAGLGCSALLPLTISLGQGALSRMTTAVAGGVIAFYQVGYGIAAFGVGPLVDNGVDLSTIYGWTAFVAAAMAVLSFAVTRREAGVSASRAAP
jgi:MFS family permease